jgi:hypothetical protein
MEVVVQLFLGLPAPLPDGSDLLCCQRFMAVHPLAMTVMFPAHTGIVPLGLPRWKPRSRSGAGGNATGLF